MPGCDLVRELKPWSSLRRVVCDAGSGLQAGIAQFQQDRRESQTEPVPLEKGLDVFHTKQEARRVLRTLWNRVERLWEQAEAASRAVEQAQRQGRDARGPAAAARAAWKKAAAAFQRYEQARDGLEAGRAGPESVSSRWSLERSVVGARADRRGPAGVVGPRVVQGPWAAPGDGVVDVPGSAARRSSANSRCPRSCAPPWCELWWLRRQRPRDADPAAVGGYRQVAPLVQQVLCQKIDPNWRESYRQVAAVLSRTVRASSAVECMNSVLRMHQSRHRTLSQGMLDLKRLYWNTRVFRGGKRHGPLPV